jgi:PKHD-type hydroxylase
MLIRIEKLLSKDEVAFCRARLETAQWEDGAASSGEQARKVKFNLQVPPESAVAREVGDVILTALGRNPTFNSAAMPLRVLPPKLNRYDVGMKFGAHVDGAIRGVPGSGARMRADLSSTLFLSEPDEYEGGELVIHDTFGEQEVKLPAGDMILYPTTRLHTVNEITRGSRWASFFWSQSMIKSDEQRSMLHELDNTIIGLRQTLPDHHPSVLSLTNLYHNLLRQWAEL